MTSVSPHPNGEIRIVENGNFDEKWFPHYRQARKALDKQYKQVARR